MFAREIHKVKLIARDGYIPKLITDIVIQKRGLDIKTKYLYGSRLAWRIPTENNYETFKKLNHNFVCRK